MDLLKNMQRIKNFSMTLRNYLDIEQYKKSHCFFILFYLFLQYTFFSEAMNIILLSITMRQ